MNTFPGLVHTARQAMGVGLSRNKVAVPEGAAGTPPFWSDNERYGAETIGKKTKGVDLALSATVYFNKPYGAYTKKRRVSARRKRSGIRTGRIDSPIAQ